MAVTEFSIMWLTLQSVLLVCAYVKYPTFFTMEKTLYTVCVMPLTHFVLYPTIWYFPKFWMSVWGSGKNAVKAFSTCVAVHKVLLAITLYALWVPSSFYDNLSSVDAVLAYLLNGKNALTLAALIWALRLQQLVYIKIGADGVYYGFKLNRDVPWCYDYPFDTIRHPQYLSASLIFICSMILLQIETSSAICLTALQIWGYAFTGLMEESGDQDGDDDVPASPKRSMSVSPKRGKSPKGGKKSQKKVA